MAQFKTTQDVSATTAGISTYAEVVRLTANSAGSSSLYLPDVGNSPIIGRGHSIIIVAAASGITTGPTIKPNPNDTGFEIDGVVAKAYDVDDAGLIVTYAGDGKWFTSMNKGDTFQIVITDTFENGENNILIPTGTPNAAFTSVYTKYEDSRFLLTSNAPYGSQNVPYFQISPEDSVNYPNSRGVSRWRHSYQEIAAAGVETMYIEFPITTSGQGYAEGGQHLVELTLMCWDDAPASKYYCAEIYIMVEVDQITFGSQIINTENWTIIADTGDFLIDLQQITSTDQIIGIRVDNNTGTSAFAHAAWRSISAMNLTI